MKRTNKTRCLILFGALFLFVTGLSATAYAQDSASTISHPDGLYIELTKEFYESLLAEERGGDRIYSNDPSTGYLKEISISMRFMVETNLQILKQQERILHLLQSVLQDKTK